MIKKIDKMWSIWDKFGVFIILVVMMALFGIMDISIIAPEQLITTLTRSAVVAVAAAGMVFAICIGGFDLSVGSILSLVSCVIAKMIVENGMNTWLAILIGVLVAVVCGLINGLIITKLKIQTFVATLATQLAFAGVALMYSQGKATQLTSATNETIKTLSTGSLFGLIPMPIVIIAIMYTIAYSLYKFFPFGVKARAMGSNEVAARSSGVNGDLIIILVFIFTAVAAALAASLNVARLSTGNPSAGAGWELDVITAVILGGTALSGGKANIFGTLGGAVLVTFVKMALNILGAGEAVQKLAVAIVLIFALSISGIKILTRKEAK